MPKPCSPSVVPWQKRAPHWSARVGLALLLCGCPQDPNGAQPHRLAWRKTQLASAHIPFAARARGLLPLRGIIHLHSVYSHDACDGKPLFQGKPNQACLRSLRRGLCDTRQDFAMLTDHSTHMAETDWDKLFSLDRTLGDEALVENGKQTGGLWRCPADASGTHRVVLTVGGENDLMPVGLHEHLGETAAARAAAMKANHADAVRAFHRASGLVLKAHGESAKLASLCSLAAAGLDGMEVYNLHANLDPDIRAEHLGLDGLGAIVGLAPFIEGRPISDGGPEPDLALVGFLEENQKQQAQFNALLGAGYRLFPIFGSDIHENTFKGNMSDGERGDSYRRLMRFFANYLLVPQKAALRPSDLTEAISRGRGFSVFEAFGSPKNFDFFAVQPDGTRAEMGDSVQVGSELVVQAPNPLPEGYETDEPLATLRVRFVAGGQTEAQTIFEQRLTAGQLAHSPIFRVSTAGLSPGAYRVEASLVPKHLLHLLGDEKARYDREYPYLFSGSLFVGKIDKHGGACQGVPL